MPRKPASSAASLYVHLQPKMASTFPVAEGVPSAMQDLLQQLARPDSLSITGRLEGLKRLFDDEAHQAAV